MTCQSCGTLVVNAVPLFLEFVEQIAVHGFLIVGFIASAVFGWRGFVVVSAPTFIFSLVVEALGRVRLASEEAPRNSRRVALGAVSVFLILVALARSFESLA